MADDPKYIRMTRGDTRPPLVRQLNQTIGTTISSIDLTNATVVAFVFRSQKGTGSALGGNCAIADPVNGVVIYTWQTADTAVVDFYEAAYKITWSDGGIQWVPSPNQTPGTDAGDFMTIEIINDIGSAPVLR